MKIHFFYNREYRGNFYNVTLESILEEDCWSVNSQKEIKSFTYIEKIHLQISKDLRRFQTVSFDIDFGLNSAIGDSSTTVKQLYKSKSEAIFGKLFPVTQKQYERLRKFCFAVYEREKMMDFSLVPEKQTKSIAILT